MNLNGKVGKTPEDLAGRSRGQIQEAQDGLNGTEVRANEVGTEK